MIDFSRHGPGVARRAQCHEQFWTGAGPSLLLLPRRHQALYDLDGYAARFEDPARMFEFELRRAREIADWPTDGIPTVRPSLGTVFVPACVGQAFQLRPGAMPWPGPPLTREEIRARRGTELSGAELMRRALTFYSLARDEADVCAYHADTQGVFDIAHLLYGTEVFADLAGDGGRPWVRELLELSLGWYVDASRVLKEAIGEPAAEMVHGHGTEQGLYFPTAGVRISEDTATLLSPEMIERDLLPFMERSASPFGGAFVHYCGKHDFLFRLLCEQPWCRAIDLGNPEMYDLPELLRICAETETVFHSRVAPEPDEGWREYGKRVGRAVAESGARCVIRATVFPEERGAAEEMLGLFHEATGV
jgi:hypothetical protein